MKARLTGVFLCIGAFVLSMIMLLNLIKEPAAQIPDIGDDKPPVTDPTTPDEGEDAPVPGVATDVTSIEGVMSVAKETQVFFDAMATDAAVSVEDMDEMLVKWENAALYLKERAADSQGAALYTTLASVFDNYTAELPKDSSDFATKLSGALSTLSSAAIEETGEKTGRYPTLDADPNGNVAMTLLRLWQAGATTAGSVTVTYGGEVAMGDYLSASTYQEIYATEDAKSPLKGLVPLFATDDVSIVSLSAPLTSYTNPDVAASEAFRGSFAETYAKHLKNAGVDVVLLSTCHVKDFGDTGYADTKAALEKAGLTVAEEGAVTYFNTTAGKVAVLAYDMSEKGDVRYSEVPKAQIKEARDAGAVLVLTYFHGTEEKEVSAAFANTLRDAADNGSDLVLSSHAANIQGILLRGEEKIPLLFSPGHLSCGAESDTNGDTYLYRESFSVVEGDEVDRSRYIYAVNNHSTGEKPNYAATIALSGKVAARVQSTLSAALPEFRQEERVTSGDLTYVCVEI